ncbi:MAG TPA: metalloregulator ArsR/SmtB family transcription factor [Streptosporangiaceae bacterium]|nr:metalloregulator ArsR/SmtB family transcription factor [Streptosporangiaceae bacterium]
MEGREAKDRLYEAFARTAKAAASPKRIELLELLAQGERTVESLARASAMSVTNTSAHLQVLARSRLVATRKDGTKIYYRLAGDDVAAFVVALRDLARSRLAEVGEVVRDYFGARDALEPVRREELLARAEQGKVVILDVRPAGEFAAGHIPGALSVPLDQLDAALDRLPRHTEIVAYCRGPYCVLAPQAVERLRARGYQARRLADGLPEWRLAGLPVAAGQERQGQG